MSLKSGDFIGIAEGLRNNELSAKSKIESLRGSISSLNGALISLESQLASLQAELSEAYEDDDEDGPNENYINRILGEISDVNSQIGETKAELSEKQGELQFTENEYANVVEEKQRTLFEIQERARQTSRNANIAGGMFGAYAGIGSKLQNAMNTSLASLTQAASILGGSVNSSGSGLIGGNSGSSANGGVFFENHTAFSIGADGGFFSSNSKNFVSSGSDSLNNLVQRFSGFSEISSSRNASRVVHKTSQLSNRDLFDLFSNSSQQTHVEKKQSFSNEFDSAQSSSDANKTSFKRTPLISELESVSSFESAFISSNSLNDSNYGFTSASSSNQPSPSATSVSSTSSTKKERNSFIERLKYYDVDHSKVTQKPPNSSSESPPDIGQRERSDDLERGFFSFGIKSCHSKMSTARPNLVSNSFATSGSTSVNSTKKERNSFIERLKYYDVDHSKVTQKPANSSSGSPPDKGQRERSDDLERGFFSFGIKSSPSKISTERPNLVSNSFATGGSPSVNSTKKERNSFIERLKYYDVDHSRVTKKPSNSSSGSPPDIGQRERSDDSERGFITGAAFGLNFARKNQYKAEYIKKKIEGEQLKKYSKVSDKLFNPKRKNNPFENNDEEIVAKNMIINPFGVTRLKFKEPRSLPKTAQIWTENSDGSLTYNSPIETGKKLDYMQGKVENFSGTCGLVCCENILRLSGVEIEEKDVINYAARTYTESNGNRTTLCCINSESEHNGGTTVETRSKILKGFNLKNHSEPQTIENIARAVENGRGVILSVDATVLYNIPSKEIAFHAVTCTSVRKSKDGKILGFYVCDSSLYDKKAGAAYYSVERLERSLTYKEMNVTDNVIR